MCEICESRKSRLGPSLNGCYTNLGDNAGNIYINEFLVFKPEDESEDIVPAIDLQIHYKGKQVYRFRQHINFCPFCGRNLDES